MKYILTSGWDDGIADLTARLARDLAAGKRVLWLTSGGSNIQATAQIMENISADLSKNLTISLIDERYGEIGHENSNWAQLLQTGFDGKQATLWPVLEAGLSLEETATRFDQFMQAAGSNFDAIIGQLGIGDDGHIAGILPDSPACAETEALAVSYESTPYRRVTLTFAGLRTLSVAYTFAFGEPKKAALERLHNETLSLSTQPAQILKELSEAYLYSDQVGDVNE